MAKNSAIEWTDHIWLPKYSGLATRHGSIGKWTGEVNLSEADVTKPLRVKKPGRPSVEQCVECGEECGPETEPVFSDGCPKCGGELEPVCPDCGHYMVYQHPDTPCLDWVIAGGESGPNARPSHPDWFRDLRDQCQAAGVPYFFKQWGDYLPADQRHSVTACLDADGRAINIGSALRTGQAIAMDGLWTYRIGKKAAGRLLDGREWNEMPETRT